MVDLKFSEINEFIIYMEYNNNMYESIFPSYEEFIEEIIFNYPTKDFMCTYGNIKCGSFYLCDNNDGESSIDISINVDIDNNYIEGKTVIEDNYATYTDNLSEELTNELFNKLNELYLKYIEVFGIPEPRIHYANFVNMTLVYSRVEQLLQELRKDL